MKDNTLSDTYDYLIYILGAALHPSSLKLITAGLIIVFSFLFDVNQSAGLLSLLILIILDFISGISASKYLGEPIRSSKVKHTAIKLTAYYAVIAGGHLAESGLVSYFAIIDETVLAFFLITELISLLENAGKLGVQTPNKLLNQLVETKNKL